MKAILSILALFGILAALPEDNVLSSSKRMLNVPASKYFADYKTNTEKANKKYKDKKVLITGKLIYMNSSCPDNPYIIIDGVECSMKNPAAAKSFDIGDEVSLSGKGAGSALNIPFLTDCELAARK
jgi:hypothetical protein